ncbi:hypothetical protein Fmac_006428 [Flemingia macrophylla]|uniref:Uncharacterized protein n=1 Tax=Flemingia macrophylla TaxID=520843 RepID=A0ABD1NB17_9FABA
MDDKHLTLSSYVIPLVSLGYRHNLLLSSHSSVPLHPLEVRVPSSPRDFNDHTVSCFKRTLYHCIRKYEPR